MKKYMNLEKKLTELKVPCYKIIELTDKSEIEILTEKQMNKEELPTNITCILWEIDDLEEVKALKEQSRKKILPKNIIKKEFSGSNGVSFEKFFYSDRFKFETKVYLEESEVDFNIQVKQTEHLESIATSMNFFHVLAWVMIIASIIGVLVILIVANT